MKLIVKLLAYAAYLTVLVIELFVNFGRSVFSWICITWDRLAECIEGDPNDLKK